MLNWFMKNMRKNKKGFTLIELVVVIAILAILALIAIPRLAGFTESARQSNDEEIAAIVANAGAMYAASHQEDGEAAIETAVENQSGLVADGLIDAAYGPTDLKSNLYDSIVVTYIAGGSVNVQLKSGANVEFSITK